MIIKKILEKLFDIDEVFPWKICNLNNYKTDMDMKHIIKYFR